MVKRTSQEERRYFLAIHLRCQLVCEDAWRDRAKGPTKSAMLMPSVLIIEDDEHGRRAVAKLFAQADWKVFEAADGDAGWNSLSGIDRKLFYATC